MKLARVLTDNGPRLAVMSEASGRPAAMPMEAAQFGDLFTRKDWPQTVAFEDTRGGRVITDPVLLNPVDRTTRIFCVGHNYRRHIKEMGRAIPDHPTVFCKLPSATIGPYDDIQLPDHSAAMDWEVELALIVGQDLRDASEDRCREAVAGYTLLNDVTARDWQFRTSQWFLGKNFERTTPLGPVIVTPEELPHDHAGNVDIELCCEINGVVRQRARTADLVFPVPQLLAYLSRAVTLRPGDIVATGIGSCVNPCRRSANAGWAETDHTGMRGNP